MLSRRGATLLELLVAMTLGAIVLGTATRSLLRQQRSAASQSARMSAESQNRAALLAMATALTGLSPAAGDIMAGEARDTALQLRAPLLNGFACDRSAGEVTLVVNDTGPAPLGAIATMPRESDSLWWYPSGESGWTARRIAEVRFIVGTCGLAGQGTREVLRITFGGADTVPSGAALRVTRQTRFSVYRSGDGSWQLGLSEWSDALQRFAPPQPIAGPFLRSGPGGARTAFRYFGASGAELPAANQAVDAPQVARIRITVLSPDRSAAVQAGAIRRDSADVALAHEP